MSLLLPAEGRVSTLQMGDVGTLYRTMGPIAVGVWFVEALVEWHCVGAQSIRWTGSVGGSYQENVGSLESGRPVVQRSFRRIGELPCLEWQVASERLGSVVVPIGILAATGSNYFTWAIVTTDVQVTTFVVSLRLARVSRGGD